MTMFLTIRLTFKYTYETVLSHLSSIFMLHENKHGSGVHSFHSVINVHEYML